MNRIQSNVTYPATSAPDPCWTTEYCKPPNVRNFRDGPQNRERCTSQIHIFKNGRVLVLVRIGGKIGNKKCNTSQNGPNLKSANSYCRGN